MNTTKYNKLVLEIIPSINKTLSQIDEIDNSFLLKWLKSDYGIVLSLEYIRDVLILKEFKENFLYFSKEFYYIKDEEIALKKCLENYILFNSEAIDESQEILLYNIYNQYQNILSEIDEIAMSKMEGEKGKEIIKDLFKYNTTEEMIGVCDQPNNTCPYIDKAIYYKNEKSDLLEDLREKCEDVRDQINNWKKELWNNSKFLIKNNKVKITFNKIPEYNVNEVYFLPEDIQELSEDEFSKKALDNYLKILNWGSTYKKAIIESPQFLIEIK